LHRLLQEMRRGALRLHPLSSSGEPYVHDQDLDAKTQLLLRAWLASPTSGYTLRVALRSNEPFSAWALKRIVRDVFGDFPVAIRMHHDEEQRHQWPLLPQQGLGGLFVADDRARAAGIPRADTRPRKLPDGEGATVGTAGGASVVLPFAALGSHWCAVGGSGTGKSTLLYNTLMAHILAGRGCGVIDPHADLADMLLASIPPERANDVVLVDICDLDFSVALNPLDGTHGNPRLQNYIASQMVDLNDRLFETSQSRGPQLNNHLASAYKLAMAHPSGGTIADVARIYEDNNFRDWLLSKTTDERLKDYFRTFVATNGSESGYAAWKPYILSRVKRLCDNPAMLRFLGRPSTINLGQLMDEGRIVLFRLSSSVLQGIELEALGSLILMQFHAAALARANRRPEQRRSFCLVVDEFQLWANETTPILLQQARKFGLGIGLATQSFSSLRRRGGDLTNAVLANCSTHAFFRLSTPDSELVKEVAEPVFTASDLSRTRNFQAVMCLSSTDVPPFLMKAAPPMRVANAVPANEIRRLSGQRWGTPVYEVDEFLVKRHNVTASDLGGESGA
jgi:hypothetical protein